jgi:putative flippase GtrA
MAPAQYARFLVCGAIVAAATLGCRELIDRLLAADNAAYYSLSIVVAYALGILLSFLLNRRFTFQSSNADRDWSKFGVFVAVALVGLVSTWAFSLALRYGLPLQESFGQASATVAFATAALLSSAITYPLSALFVFRRAQ